MVNSTCDSASRKRCSYHGSLRPYRERSALREIAFIVQADSLIEDNTEKSTRQVRRGFLIRVCRVRACQPDDLRGPDAGHCHHCRKYLANENARAERKVVGMKEPLSASR